MTVSMLVYLATFCGVTLLVIVCFDRFARFDRQIGDRISELSPRSISTRTKKSRVRPQATPRNALAQRLMPSEADGRLRLQAQLINAGIYSPNAVPLFVSIKMVLAAIPAIAGLLAASLQYVEPYWGMLCGSGLGGLGLILPSVWLAGRKRKWHRVINGSLTDFLDLMVACLETGLSPEAAFQRVTEELRLAHPRLSVELSVVQAQIDLGVSFDEALRNFAERSDCDAIRSVANVVRQGKKLGGGMAEVFRQQAESLRARREHQAEEKAQQAAVKILLPTLLCIFPVIFVVLAGPAVIKLTNMFQRDFGSSRTVR